MPSPFLCVLAMLLTTSASKLSSKWPVLLSWLYNIKMPSDFTLSILPRTLYQHNGVFMYQPIVLVCGSFCVGVHFSVSAVFVLLTFTVKLHLYLNKIVWQSFYTFQEIRFSSCLFHLVYLMSDKKIKIVTTETKFVQTKFKVVRRVWWQMQCNDSSDKLGKRHIIYCHLMLRLQRKFLVLQGNCGWKFKPLNGLDQNVVPKNLCGKFS